MLVDNEFRKEMLKKERALQEATINLKKKYGKNAILKGMNLQEGATTIDRNNQIGGHKDGIEDSKSAHAKVKTR